jgi:hypothetical protein
MSQVKFQKVIDACIESAIECNHCAVSCIEEKDVQNLAKCIRLAIECAIVCRATAELLSIDSRYTKELCSLCAAICNACAEECEKHIGMEACKECAATCRTCADETLEVYQILSKQSDETNEHFIHHDECSVVSRAAAELISLQSTFSKEISELNATISNAYAEECNIHLNRRMSESKLSAKVAVDAHKKLASKVQQTNEANEDRASKSNDGSELKEDGNNKEDSYDSALLKAYMYSRRSAVSHVRRHAYKDGNFANMGTNLSYREDQ